MYSAVHVYGTVGLYILAVHAYGTVGLYITAERARNSNPADAIIGACVRGYQESIQLSGAYATRQQA
jgi:hypothetical protein